MVLVESETTKGFAEEMGEGGFDNFKSLISELTVGVAIDKYLHGIHCLNTRRLI